jgi:hypothetical protein
VRPEGNRRRSWNVLPIDTGALLYRPVQVCHTLKPLLCAISSQVTHNAVNKFSIVVSDISLLRGPDPNRRFLFLVVSRTILCGGHVEFS